MLRKVLLLLIMVNSYLQADGCYMAPRAILTTPEIPSQQAIISFRNGEETLIINSEAKSEAKDLGWIVPLPSIPAEIKKADDGLIEVLNQNTGIKIIHTGFLRGEIWGFIFLVFIPLSIIVWKCKKNQKDDILIYFCVYSILIVLSAASMPASSGTTGLKASDTVQLIKQSQVGNYDTKVITATDAIELNNWLKKKGLAEFPEEANDILKQYIDDGWCFVCMKLTRSEAGQNAPHPIQFKFPVEKPVYPMKLTALAKSIPNFSLYVISDKVSSHPRLETIQNHKLELNRYRNNKDDDYYINRFSRLDKNRFGNLLWDNAILSRLDGSLSPEEMKDDLYFEQSEFVENYQKLNFTWVWCANLIVLGIWTVLLVYFAFIKSRTKRVTKNFWLTVLIASVVLALVYKEDIIFNFKEVSRYDSPRHYEESWADQFLNYIEKQLSDSDQPNSLELVESTADDYVEIFSKSGRPFSQFFQGKGTNIHNYNITETDKGVQVDFFLSSGRIISKTF